METLGNGMNALFRYFGGASKGTTKSDDAPIWFLGRQLECKSPLHNVPAAADEDESQGDAVAPRTSSNSATSTGSEPSHVCADECVCPRGIRNAQFSQAIRDLVWCTYRRNFAPLYTGSPASPTTESQPSLTSDTGWGCMVRSGQMLLANALIRHTEDAHSADPLHPESISQKTILSWFVDRPHPESPYSIHHIVNTGRHLGKPVGDWFGPATISEVLTLLVNEHKPAGLIALNCCEDATVYASDVLDAATGGETDDGSAEWKPLLILVQVRLGLAKMNPVYRSALLRTFELPQCVGILGGRPKAAGYFVAAHGEHVYYLDPHTVQETLSPEDVVNDESTYHTNNPQLSMHVSELDPSLAIGFYIRGRSDFANFCVAAKEIESDGNAVFHVAQERPDYHNSDIDCDVVSLDSDSDHEGEDGDDTGYAPRDTA